LETGDRRLATEQPVLRTNTIPPSRMSNSIQPVASVDLFDYSIRAGSAHPATSGLPTYCSLSAITESNEKHIVSLNVAERFIRQSKQRTAANDRELVHKDLV